jgi:hypothetical protein
MDFYSHLKRVAGLLVVALLVPGGSVIALAVLLAGRSWEESLARFIDGGKAISWGRGLLKKMLAHVHSTPIESP